MRYIFTHYKDQCPVCCPKPEPDEDDYDYDQSVNDDDLTPESEYSYKHCRHCPCIYRHLAPDKA